MPKIFSNPMILLVGLIQLVGINVPAAGENLTFLDMARYPDGTVMNMNQSDAIAYCKCDSDYARNVLGCSTSPNSAHLPHARELAELAVSYGAKGIVDTCHTGQSCHIIPFLDGSKDSFYFSYAGYKHPAGDHGFYFYWSSSKELKFPYPGIILRGETGVLDHFDPIWSAAVRCAVGGI